MEFGLPEAIEEPGRRWETNMYLEEIFFVADVI
jgi:hypothetical protein